MNADSGFDTQAVHEKYAGAGIEANIYQNIKNKKEGNDEYRYFDDELQKKVHDRENKCLAGQPQDFTGQF